MKHCEFPEYCMIIVKGLWEIEKFTKTYNFSLV